MENNSIFTWVVFDASLYDLSDVLEGSSILLHHVVAQGYAITDVGFVAYHLEHSVEVRAGFVVAFLLRACMYMCMFCKDW